MRIQQTTPTPTLIPTPIPILTEVNPISQMTRVTPRISIQTAVSTRVSHHPRFIHRASRGKCGPVAWIAAAAGIIL